MTYISQIRIGDLTQEGYGDLVKYIEEVGTIEGQEKPLFEIEGVSPVSGNPPSYERMTLKVNPVVELPGSFRERYEEVEVRLTGLISLIGDIVLDEMIP